MKRPKEHSNRCRRQDLRPLFLLGLGLCLCTTVTLAQSTPPAATTTSTVGVLPTIAAPSQWDELDSGQRLALYPLKNSWPELSDIQRRKWTAIVKNFPKLKPEEQAKLQERMSAWAALNPLERERARENFASSKLTKPSAKANSWEEYRALPQEERDKLASQTTKKRQSAAKTSKPSHQIPLLIPPHVQRPATEERNELRSLITPDTLLPRNLNSPHQ